MAICVDIGGVTFEVRRCLEKRWEGSGEVLIASTNPLGSTSWIFNGGGEEAIRLGQAIISVASEKEP